MNFFRTIDTTVTTDTTIWKAGFTKKLMRRRNKLIWDKQNNNKENTLRSYTYQALDWLPCIFWMTAQYILDDVVPRNFLDIAAWVPIWVDHFLLLLHLSIFHPRAAHLEHDYFFLYFINDLRLDAICSTNRRTSHKVVHFICWPTIWEVWAWRSTERSC